MKYWLAFLLVLQCSFASYAREAAPLAEDPVVEQRMISITEELRCLVCQNESLAASRAELAQDLRSEVRDLIRAKKTDQEIRDYLVQRYGDFVLYRPTLKPLNYLLWFGPFILLVGGILFLVRLVQRNQRSEAPPPLDPAQRAKAQSLLHDPELKS